MRNGNNNNKRKITDRQNRNCRSSRNRSFVESTPVKESPIHFPKNFLSEIDEESDFFIIYLSGTPIKKMKNKKDIALNIQELDVREWDQYSQSGYHLIKLGPLETWSQIRRNHNAIGMASS